MVGRPSSTYPSIRAEKTCTVPDSLVRTAENDGELWAGPPVLSLVPSQANHSSSLCRRFQTVQTPEKIAHMASVSRNSNDGKTQKHVFLFFTVWEPGAWGLLVRAKARNFATTNSDGKRRTETEGGMTFHQSRLWLVWDVHERKGRSFWQRTQGFRQVAASSEENNRDKRRPQTARPRARSSGRGVARYGTASFWSVASTCPCHQ